ncbi:hypothetical protein ACFO0N_07375 [Halobium salinum]|uniref:Uncharacterized protein n=1 Tax=Halobium salinum TaxID=1364940 RepID=A0ABD5PA49_9EURY|nr:hypothetical protein [Halobium salinum]
MSAGSPRGLDIPETLTASASLNKHEDLREYHAWAKEYTDCSSSSDVVRRAYQYAIQNDTEFRAFLAEHADAEAGDGAMGLDTKDKYLPAVDGPGELDTTDPDVLTVAGGKSAVDLSDPDSIVHDWESDTRVPIMPRDLAGRNWEKNVASKIKPTKDGSLPGRIGVYRRATEGVDLLKSGFTKQDWREQMSLYGGVSKGSLSKVFELLVSKNTILPHPSMGEAALTESALQEARREIAGVEPGEKLSPEDEKRIPDSWEEVLPLYHKFARDQYYSYESEFLDRSIKAFGLALASIAAKNEGYSGDAIKSVNGEEQAVAWRVAAQKINMYVAGKLPEWREYSLGDEFDGGTLYAEFFELVDRAEGFGWDVDKDSAEYQTFVADALKFQRKAYDLVGAVGGADAGNAQSESSVREDEGMSVSEALNVLGVEGGDGLTTEDVMDRFREVAFDHPDLQDGWMDMGDRVEARDTLLEELESDRSVDVEGGGSGGAEQSSNQSYKPNVATEMSERRQQGLSQLRKMESKADARDTALPSADDVDGFAESLHEWQERVGNALGSAAITDKYVEDVERGFSPFDTDSMESLEEWVEEWTLRFDAEMLPGQEYSPEVYHGHVDADSVQEELPHLDRVRRASLQPVESVRDVYVMSEDGGRVLVGKESVKEFEQRVRAAIENHPKMSPEVSRFSRDWSPSNDPTTFDREGPAREKLGLVPDGRFGKAQYYESVKEGLPGLDDSDGDEDDLTFGAQ